MTEEEKPLTREEVLKMIEEHGGPQGLDLGDRNLERIDLASRPDGPTVDLHGIILYGANLKEADLSHANLQEATLPRADMQHTSLTGTNLQEANLYGANLQEANLWAANLHQADLRWAKLSKAYLYEAKISRETRLENVDWGVDYVSGDEEDSEKDKYKNEKRLWLRQAESAYRNLKQWHTQAGIYDIAGEFYAREMTVKRKALRWWPRPVRWRKRRWWGEFLFRPQLEAYRFLCGYGEKPWRVAVSAAVVVFGLAGIYSASALTFPSSLYHSAVSFTALGYGLGASTADGWVKAVGAFEAFIGVFMMALFLITFVRKMIR